MRASSHVNCCGYVPITVGVGEPDDESALQALIGIVQGQSEEPSTYTNRVYEIILNDNQTKARPKLLKLMAALGFVFMGRMNNGNHDSWVNIFHRYQRNGREYVKPKFKWDGFSVAEQIADYQVEPVKFKRAEVVNPFLKAKGIFNTAQITEVVKA